MERKSMWTLPGNDKCRNQTTQIYFKCVMLKSATATQDYVGYVWGLLGLHLALSAQVVHSKLSNLFIVSYN